MYMSLTWVKPLPLLFMTASVLLMWAPSRAFLGAAVSKLPRLVLSKRRRCSTATDHHCRTTLASVTGQDRTVDEARKVIIITGEHCRSQFVVLLSAVTLNHLLLSVDRCLGDYSNLQNRVPTIRYICTFACIPFPVTQSRQRILKYQIVLVASPMAYLPH